YRSETSRLVADDFVLYTALYFILGQPTDRPINAWQEMFLPMRMRERLSAMKISDEAGNEIPLVKKEILLHTSKRYSLRVKPPNWIGWFLLAGLIIGSVEVWLAHLARRDSRRAAWIFVIVAVLWSLLAGVAGWLLIYFWTLTDHLVTRDNENLLQLSPLMLPLVVLIPLAMGKRQRAAKAALIFAGLSLVGCLLGLAIKILPSMYQINGNMIALAIPANAGLVWALWMLNVKRKTS
ncbi:MAG TPA: hypothetical protein VKK61_04480, partial [Tepidisphaeraceae bacterium]|nr:hypothetical protein [Tepidisphaeraceae bacterium]